MDTWRRMADSKFRVMPHFASDSNIHEICEYLLSQGASLDLDNDPGRAEFHHRVGGYIERAVEWPTLDFTLGQKKLIIDADCVTPLLSEMRQIRRPDFVVQERKFYYSRNSKYLLALDQGERESLMAQLEQGRKEADAIASAFTRQLEDHLAELYIKHKLDHRRPPSSLRLVLPLFGRN